RSEPRVSWMWGAARTADPDPSGWRERFRSPRAWNFPRLSQQLADEADIAAQPVQLLVGLADEMYQAKVDNLPFLRRVQEVYPSDFWVNFRLGDGLLRNDPEEGIRYLQAALAVRPRAAVVLLALGHALAAGKRLAQARNCFLT